MVREVARADRRWLELREPADAAARSVALVERLHAVLPPGPLVGHDLGAGSGSMVRWISPRLPGPQRWVLHDRDAELVGLAAAYPWPMPVQTHLDDVTDLAGGPLDDADLLTASALLDMMSGPELERFLTGCATGRCPLLIALSVVGRVELSPSDPLDPVVRDAFNAHQRRTVEGRTLLGPDAFGVAVDRLTRLGYDVTTAPSPWLLGGDHEPLVRTWFDGWVAAAVEQEPGLAGPVAAYAERRRAQAATGTLTLTVHHADLLAVPRGSAARGHE